MVQDEQGPSDKPIPGKNKDADTFLSLPDAQTHSRDFHCFRTASGAHYGGHWIEGPAVFGKRITRILESKPGFGCIHSLDTMETTYPPPLPPAASPQLTNVCTWAALCHASALLGVFLHFPGHLIGPLIVWLVKRGDAPEIDAHGKEALNFQISMLIYNIVAAVFCLILIGFVFLAILWVLNAVLVIIAAIQASDGKFYRYPMTIRFIQ